MAHYSKTDRVKRIYVSATGVHIRHQSMSSGYKTVKPDHNNYNQLYSLALLAAANGLPLWIRTKTNTMDDVAYLVIDW